MSGDPSRRLIMEPNEVGNGTLHPDASPCMDGVRKVPKRFKACCDEFNYRTSACQFDIHYEKHGRKWGILLPDCGSYIEIKFCPHCGEAL